jgi:hypothetical protein
VQHFDPKVTGSRRLSRHKLVSNACFSLFDAMLLTMDTEPTKSITSLLGGFVRGRHDNGRVWQRAFLGATITLAALLGFDLAPVD